MLIHKRDVKIFDPLSFITANRFVCSPKKYFKNSCKKSDTKQQKIYLSLREDARKSGGVGKAN